MIKPRTNVLRPKVDLREPLPEGRAEVVVAAGVAGEVKDLVLVQQASENLCDLVHRLLALVDRGEVASADVGAVELGAARLFGGRLGELLRDEGSRVADEGCWLETLGEEFVELLVVVGVDELVEATEGAREVNDGLGIVGVEPVDNLLVGSSSEAAGGLEGDDGDILGERSDGGRADVDVEDLLGRGGEDALGESRLAEVLREVRRGEEVGKRWRRGKRE